MGNGRSMGLGSRVYYSLGALGVLCGCESDDPAIQAAPQEITFDSPATVAVDQTSVTLVARASSGLPVIYSSRTPEICSVDATTGVVTALRSGVCTVAADQTGDSRFAAARQVTADVTFQLSSPLRFTGALTLGLYDVATVTAVSTSDQPVVYASRTPDICSVHGSTGQVMALAPGNCTLSATAGSQEITQTATIAAVTAMTAPGMPQGVQASLTNAPGSVSINVAAVSSGGQPITGYTVTSVPAGLFTSSPALPVTISCGTGCGGYRFTVAAVNAAGAGLASDPAEIISHLGVTAEFYEPDTQPNNTRFIGDYWLNSTTNEVSQLRGLLSEAMTGGMSTQANSSMNWLELDHQLSSIEWASGHPEGRLVTTFLLDTTHTFTNDPALAGVDGWSPGTGSGLYYGYPGENPGNAYVRIFVNTIAPLEPLSAAQINTLAYADCAPGGMMGATCMTGTTAAGYGSVGTMSGYPVQQHTELK